MNFFTKSIQFFGVLTITALFSVTALAQKTIWSDDFATNLAPWTTLDKSTKKSGNLWVRSTVGPTGMFKIDPIKSATAANGYALFDSDTYCSGSQDAWLISPTIDNSANATGVLFFAQQYRKYLDKSFVMASDDDGATWKEFEVNGDLDDTDAVATNPTITEVDLTSLIANKPKVKIAFRFLSDDGSADAGCGYSWMIDDVKLVEKPKNTLVLADFLFGPANYSTPASQIEGTEMQFAVDVKNAGSVAQPNVKLKVQVMKMTDVAIPKVEKVIYSDSLTFTTLASGLGSTTDSTFTFAKNYVAGKLAAGLYMFNYTIASKDSTDFNPSDNTASQFFRVSKNIFAKENAPQNGLRSSTGDYAVGNMYTTSKNWATGNFVTKNIYFAAAGGATDPLIGKDINFYLFEVDDKIDADFNNFDDKQDLTSNDGLKLVGVSNYVFPDTTANYKMMKVKLEDFATNLPGVSLVANKRYFLAVEYVGNSKTIFHAFSKRINYFQTALLPVSTFTYSGTWFLGGFGTTDAAVLRMEVDLKTTSDDLPLAETVMGISPNPANDYINLDLNFEQAADINVVIADVTGKILDMKDFDGVSKQKVQMATDNLAAGTYLIRVTTKEGTKTKKFVVQH